ncbi:unnamed protein product [Ilex paraguariensis]|uniref:Uncharacterized protein n=1 Tax=Ilex paraguariensis TaxID=185542 RepID=A0ABC8TAZ8_9AQUA
MVKIHLCNPTTRENRVRQRKCDRNGGLRRREIERGMSDPYERAKGGRLTFKGGSLATRSKPIDKKKKKKNKHKASDDVASEEQILGEEELEAIGDTIEVPTTAAEGGEIYTIDAAKRRKYEDLFPVEAKKFGYKDPQKTNFKSVEEALDDRVKKKADRYCK